MTARLLAFAAALALTACGEPEPATMASVEPAPAVKAEKHVQDTQYMKPGAPVLIESDVLTLAPGQAGKVEVRIIAQAPGMVDVSWRMPTTLQSGTSGLSTEAQGFSAPEGRSLSMKAGGSQTLTLDIPPSAEGRHYIPVTATLNGQTRAMNVTIQVGKGGPLMQAAPGELMTTPDGESVIVMRATETINGQPVE